MLYLYFEVEVHSINYQLHSNIWIPMILRWNDSEMILLNISRKNSLLLSSLNYPISRFVCQSFCFWFGLVETNKASFLGSLLSFGLTWAISWIFSCNESLSMILICFPSEISTLTLYPGKTVFLVGHQTASTSWRRRVS